MNKKESECNKVEEELIASYALLRIAGETAKFGGWSMTLPDCLITWSRQVAVIHEVPEDYIPVLSEGINFYAPEYRQKITEVFKNCIENGIPYDEVLQIISYKGRRIWVRTTGEALKNDSGQIIKVHGSFQDISGLMKVEEELEYQNNLLKTLMDILPMGVFMVEAPSGKPIIANNTAKKLLGRGILPDASRNNLREVYQAYYHSTNDLYNIDEMPIIKGMHGQVSHVDNLEVLRPDGTRILLEIFGAPILNADGSVKASLVSFMDITERKLSAEKMECLNQEMEELNKTKDKMFSIIAHDLKAPFNSILGFSELLSENSGDYNAERCREFGEVIRSSAHQSLALLENLLFWAQSQTGKISLNPVQINLKNTIQEVAEVMQSSAIIKQISINVSPSTDVEIFADRNMLMTILRNLISNAIKFTHLGGKIEICSDIRNQIAEIIISDNGTGMSREIIDSLFHIGSQKTMRGTSDEIGSGLGLILCKEFAEKHGGKIWVESYEGKGSRFHFTIRDMRQ